jgi:hypothetical protein
MPIDPNQLDALVRQADPATPDADLASQLSTPVKTPRRDRVTYTTCAATWGTVVAATFAARLQGAIAAGGAFAPVAAFVDKVLSGPGIDPASPEVPAQSAAFVAAGLATQEQVDGVFFNVTFPAGDVVQAADVTASRARVADRAARAKVMAALAAVINDWVAAQPSSPSAAAVVQQVQASLAEAGVQ